MKYLLVLLLSLVLAQQDPAINEGDDPTLENVEEEEVPPVTSSIIVDDVKYNCGNTNLIGET